MSSSFGDLGSAVNNICICYITWSISIKHGYINIKNNWEEYNVIQV